MYQNVFQVRSNIPTVLIVVEPIPAPPIGAQDIEVTVVSGKQLITKKYPSNIIFFDVCSGTLMSLLQKHILKVLSICF